MNTPEGDNESTHSGFMPTTIPDAQSASKGVSVKYLLSEGKCWFVFRVSYGREDKAYDFIVGDGTYAYIPKKYAEEVYMGKKRRVLKSIIPNLLFVYTTPRDAERYVKHTPELSFLSYYYNHFKKDTNGKNPPLTIPYYEMENFILATCNNNEHLLFVKPSQCHYKSGDLVRVTDGPFTGVLGKVARVAGQQRVVVSLSDLGLISTAYIPTAFIQHLCSE